MNSLPEPLQLSLAQIVPSWFPPHHQSRGMLLNVKMMIACYMPYPPFYPCSCAVCVAFQTLPYFILVVVLFETHKVSQVIEESCSLPYFPLSCSLSLSLSVSDNVLLCPVPRRRRGNDIHSLCIPGHHQVWLHGGKWSPCPVGVSHHVLLLHLHWSLRKSPYLFHFSTINSLPFSLLSSYIFLLYTLSNTSRIAWKDFRQITLEFLRQEPFLELGWQYDALPHCAVPRRILPRR